MQFGGEALVGQLHLVLFLLHHLDVGLGLKQFVFKELGRFIINARVWGVSFYVFASWLLFYWSMGRVLSTSLSFKLFLQ